MAEPTTTFRRSEDNGVLTFTLTRDDKLNAVAPEMIDGLRTAVDDLGDPDDLRVLVIAAEGRYFTAGIDINDSGAGGKRGYAADGSFSPRRLRRGYRGFHLLLDELESIEKPSVLAAHARCLEVGVEIAAYCDFRLAADGASFALPELPNLAVIPGSGGVSRVTRLVGPHWGKWLAFGEEVSADLALTMGLVHAVYPAESFRMRVAQFARKLAALPSEAAGVAKMAVDVAASVDRGTARDFDRFANTVLLASDEHKRMVAAFGNRKRKSVPMSEQTLAAHILAGAADHDGCPLIFVTGDGEYPTTLGALVSDAERVAGALQARGIGQGDVVAVQLPGSYEGAVVQAAVTLCGAVLLPLVMIYGPRELGFALRQAGASAVVLCRQYRGRPQASAVLSGLSALKLAVVVGDSAPGHGAIGYTELLGGPGGRYRQPRCDPDDRAMLLYTSGTTAEPKGVQHSHRTLLAEARSRVYHRNGPGARHLGLFPPGHMAGLTSLLRTLLLGTPGVIMQSWDAALAARLIDRHQVTSSVGAPVQLSGLLDLHASGTASLASLAEFLTGAAPVPPSLIRRADAAGITAFRSYGSNEHPTVSTGSIADSLDRRAGTDGALIAGNEVRIVDAAGHCVPAGAARTSPPRRSRTCWSPTPPSRTRPSSRHRTRSWANGSARSWCRAPAARSTSRRPGPTSRRPEPPGRRRPRSSCSPTSVRRLAPSRARR